MPFFFSNGPDGPRRFEYFLPTGVVLQTAPLGLGWVVATVDGVTSYISRVKITPLKKGVKQLQLPID